MRKTNVGISNPSGQIVVYFHGGSTIANAYMPGIDTIKLLRLPFSLLLMPVFLLAVSQAEPLNVQMAVVSFLIIHLLVYPASNGYNSYIDRDEGSIGGLERPPMPTKALFYLTLVMDIAAVLLAALLVKWLFAACILLYILASRAYSAPQVRLKRFPLLGFLTVFLFQGGFTYYMSSVGISDGAFTFSMPHLYIMLACSFQIAGAYPLTQIYQHEADLKDGVVTLSYKLGYRGTFAFTAIMFILCNVLYFLYFRSVEQEQAFALLQLFFLPVAAYFAWWWWQVVRSTANASFKNTMRMNLIAALCMNGFFLFLIITKYLV